jgi:hypothetical protein
MMSKQGAKNIPRTSISIKASKNLRGTKIYCSPGDTLKIHVAFAAFHPDSKHVKAFSLSSFSGSRLDDFAGDDQLPAGLYNIPNCGKYRRYIQNV